MRDLKTAKLHTLIIPKVSYPLWFAVANFTTKSKIMDSTTFREMILADYIEEVKHLSREELLNRLLDLKYRVLESSSDDEVVQQYEQRRQKQTT